MGKLRAGSVLLPLLALFWLAAIYAGALFGRPYTVDVGLNRGSGDALVVRSSAIATRFGMPQGARVLFSRMSPVQRRRYASTPRGAPVSVVVSYKGTTRTVAVPATLAVDQEAPVQRIFELVTMSFSLLLAAYLGVRLPGIMIAALICFLGGGGIAGESFAALFHRITDSIFGFRCSPWRRLRRGCPADPRWRASVRSS